MRKLKTIRIDTTDVQGEGSFVDVLAISWDEFEEIQSLSNEAVVDRARSFLAEHVIDWNWTDNHDEPLPSPAQDPSVIGKLIIPEVVYLMRRIPQEGLDQGNLQTR